MQYIKQLDSLRAIAVLFVIIHHWIPKDNILNSLPNGAIGVDIFFVLSGFLITKILFDAKNTAEDLGGSKRVALKNFYARRTLRIFPIYYITLFVLLIFHSATTTQIKPAFLYYATYVSNFYFFSRQSFDGMLSHLWSLAVEEQFYLFWPWIILFTKRKYLLPVIAGFILIGSGSNFLLRQEPMREILTFTCFDAFGLGALLSWQMTYRAHNLHRFYKNLSIAAGIAALFFILYVIRISIVVPLRLINATIALWLITFIVIHAQSSNPLFRSVWNNRGLVFLGRISYGLYLYHNLIPFFNSKVINVYLKPLLPEVLSQTYWGIFFLVENALVLVLLAWFSYVFIEKRFLSLKKYFQYKESVPKVQVMPELLQLQQPGVDQPFNLQDRQFDHATHPEKS